MINFIILILLINMSSVLSLLPICGGAEMTCEFNGSRSHATIYTMKPTDCDSSASIIQSMADYYYQVYYHDDTFILSDGTEINYCAVVADFRYRTNDRYDVLDQYHWNNNIDLCLTGDDRDLEVHFIESGYCGILIGQLLQFELQQTPDIRDASLAGLYNLLYGPLTCSDGTVIQDGGSVQVGDSTLISACGSIGKK